MNENNKARIIEGATSTPGKTTPTHKTCDPCATMSAGLLQRKQFNSIDRSEKPDYCSFNSLAAWIPGFGRRIGGI